MAVLSPARQDIRVEPTGPATGCYVPGYSASLRCSPLAGLLFRLLPGFRCALASFVALRLSVRLRLAGPVLRSAPAGRAWLITPARLYPVQVVGGGAHKVGPAPLFFLVASAPDCTSAAAVPGWSASLASFAGVPG